MNNSNNEYMLEKIIDILGTPIKKYGYKYLGTYPRPKNIRPGGFIVEFIRENAHLFVMYHPDYLSIDLILQLSNDKYMRIPIHPLLASNGFRGLISPGITSDEELNIFLTEFITDRYKSLLTGQESNFDERYCVPFSEDTYKKYISEQRNGLG